MLRPHSGHQDSAHDRDLRLAWVPRYLLSDAERSPAEQHAEVLERLMANRILSSHSKSKFHPSSTIPSMSSGSLAQVEVLEIELHVKFRLCFPFRLRVLSHTYRSPDA